MKLAIEDVTFVYPSGVQALDGVSLRIAAGETVAIVGENGAGKSTLARHLNGLLKPTSGRVLVGEWDTRDHTVAQLARRVGFAFQNPDDQLFATTVRADVAFGPRNLGLDATAVAARVDASLTAVGLTAVADTHPYDLSPAQRKLVSLAATLALDTPILLLDEPTAGQDSGGQERVAALIAARQAAGHTVIAITHDIDFAAAHFDRIVVMAGGSILADGPAGDVLSQSALLARAEVTPPQLIRLAAALGLPGAPVDVDAFLTLLTRHKEGL